MSEKRCFETLSCSSYVIIKINECTYSEGNFLTNGTYNIRTLDTFGIQRNDLYCMQESSYICDFNSYHL